MPEFRHEHILIEGLIEGNEKIFDYLFHLYYSGLIVFVQRYVPDRAAAEDIVQDFFFKLWVNRKSIKITQSLKSYIFTSVKNSCLDYIRHQQVVRKSETYLAGQAQKIENDTDYMIETELREYIQVAVDKLPPACREIFILNKFDGLKPAEIARQKNISVRTVEAHIGKALRIMKTELHKYMPATLVAIVLDSLLLS